MGSIVDVEALTQVSLPNGDVDLVIDALFGTGMKRPLPGALAKIAATWSEYDIATDGQYLVAVDVPEVVRQIWTAC